MSKSSNEYNELSAEIVAGLKGVAKQWQRLREIDSGASDFQFRATLKSCGLPGGLRAANQTPLTVN